MAEPAAEAVEPAADAGPEAETGELIGLSCPVVDAADRPNADGRTREGRPSTVTTGWQTYDGCFGCGTANPIGLHLCGAIADAGPHRGRYVMAVHLPANYQGGRGVIHGGIQAVVLDEVFGQAIHVLGPVDRAIVTADFKLRYRRPAPTETALLAAAWIEERRGSWFTVAGHLVDAEGTVLTEATARWRVLH
jgi:acyl-coenzyme A thioesterase PaaI-like protein